jgi:phospholipase/carboxylesterase
MIMELSFVHRFVPASDPNSKTTLLALHGTGADESDLIPLAQTMAPGAAVLSPRGKVLENGMPRFFRRLREGVFDEQDLIFRARELAQFVAAASAKYHFDPAGVVAMGYSNGANIAAAVLLLHPGVIPRAVLFRPMVPLQPDPLPDLHAASVFIGAGRLDPIVPQADTERLAALLRGCGAQVSLHWVDAYHGLTLEEVPEAGRWLSTKHKAPQPLLQLPRRTPLE